jgi:hypothetical protein
LKPATLNEFVNKNINIELLKDITLEDMTVVSNSER